MDTPHRAGIVLAGGFSTRFGEHEKALAKLDGKPLLAHSVTGIAPAVDGVLVNCRQEQVPQFRDALASVSADVAFVCDPEPDRGPAAGLATACDAVDASCIAVVACDMPFVDATFLEWLLGAIDDTDGVVPYINQIPQPTHAVFATDPTQRAAVDAVENESGSLQDVLDRLDIVEMPESRVIEETDKTTFVDVNTPEDLEKSMANGPSHS